MSSTLKKERQAEELVTRFFAYGDGLEKYHDRPKDFIFSYSKTMNTEFIANPSLSDQYRRRFIDTMKFVERTFPYGFRKTPNGNATPRARFEAIAIGSYLALRERPELKDPDPEPN